MSTRKHSPRTRGFRPEADALETRQMLSGVVSGFDSKGDAFTLRLVGPGALSVVKQDGPDGKPPALSSATDINTITIGGTDPTRSRLTGTVVKGANSDGRVFFQQMIGLPARSVQFPSAGLGLVSINMPNFWLGNTTASTATNPAPAASILLPDGVETLRFGGVDTTFNRPAPTSTTTSDADTVTLGLPTFGGTRVIIDKAISSSQAVPAAPTATNPNPSPTTAQHGVTFAVAGRLSLFQANEIDGNAVTPPGQFLNENPAAKGSGGTTVFSGTVGTSPFLANGEIKGAGITGQIGDVRVGRNATNFTTLVNDATQSGNDRISNFFIGGETDNVLLVAPNGSRNVVFGKGMDTVEIRSHVINTLKANRGALNSNVFVDREIGRIDLGGDVQDTTVLSGYQQNFTGIFGDVTGQTNSLFGGGQPTAPRRPINAQPFGGMTVHVAGDVTNSVFAASVEPFTPSGTPTPTPLFGDPNQIVLPGGHIRSKVEGKIDNAVATPSTPNQAFFAQKLDRLSGPVIPPDVPEAPYTGPQQPVHLPGIGRLSATPRATASSATVHSALHTSTPVIVGNTTPKGPRKA